MNEQIDTTIKRVRSYWFVDGFIEMIAGGLFIILAAIFLLRLNEQGTSFPSWFLSVIGVVSIAKLVGLLAAILILWWLKDRFTYPRTGFIRGNRITAAQIWFTIRNAVLFLLLPIFGLLAMSVLIISAGSVLSSMPVWFPIALGLIWSALCVLAGEWMGLRRFGLIGIMMLLAGMTVGIWQFALGLPAFPANIQPGILQPPLLDVINRTMSSLGFLILICGVILITSGVVTFLRYRKENPTPYAEVI